jgi:hypothetical protein
MGPSAVRQGTVSALTETTKQSPLGCATNPAGTDHIRRNSEEASKILRLPVSDSSHEKPSDQHCAKTDTRTEKFNEKFQEKKANDVTEI